MALEHAHERPPDVTRAAERLRRPRARVSLAFKRSFDLFLALLLLVALSPVAALIAALLTFGGKGWLEPRPRLGRDGRMLQLRRFRRPPGRLGRALERIGAREIPVLASVVSGRMSFVGPRALAPGSAARGVRSLMAPGLVGPAQRWAVDGETAAELDDVYVSEWSLVGDAKLLFGAGRRGPLAVRR